MAVVKQIFIWLTLAAVMIFIAGIDMWHYLGWF